MNDPNRVIIPFNPNKIEREKERNEYLKGRVAELEAEVEEKLAERDKILNVISRLGETGLSLVEEV